MTIKRNKMKMNRNKMIKKRHEPMKETQINANRCKMATKRIKATKRDTGKHFVVVLYVVCEFLCPV